MKIEDYKLLLDINTALSKTQTRSELIRLIFNEVNKAFTFNCPGLFTIDSRGEYHTELSDANCVMDPVNRYVYEHMDGNSYPHKGTAIEYWSNLERPKIFDLKHLHENIATHPHFPHMLNAGLKTTMAGALVHEGRKVGTLCLSSEDPRAYCSEDIPTFEAVCNQLAIAVSNLQSKDKIALNDWVNTKRLDIINAFHKETTWEGRLIHLAGILGISIPFDTVSFSMMGERFKEVNFGIQRTGAQEYRAISLEAFLEMTQIDIVSFREYLSVSKTDSPTISNTEDYKMDLEAHEIKRKINQIFKIQSSLTFVLEVNSEKFHIGFYSKQKNPYHQTHITLFENLQSTLVQA